VCECVPLFLLFLFYVFFLFFHVYLMYEFINGFINNVSFCEKTDVLYIDKTQSYKPLVLNFFGFLHPRREPSHCMSTSD